MTRFDGAVIVRLIRVAGLAAMKAPESDVRDQRTVAVPPLGAWPPIRALVFEPPVIV